MSKVFKKCWRGTSSFPGARFRKFKKNQNCTIFKTLKIEITNFLHFKISRFQNKQMFGIQDRNRQFKKLGKHTSQQFQNFRFSDMKNKMLKNVPIFSCIVWNIFRDKYGVRGSRFSQSVGSSRNHPKSIAICPGVKISHFGIIQNPQNPNN